MAGHSKWANIKHRKARQDAKKGKDWSRCARAIIVAAKDGGGNPDMNLTLRYAIDEAKSCNMTKDTIEKAIKKGTGELAGESYVPAVYEGYGPNGVAVMIETLTDNKNRTVSEIRKIFEKSGGNMGTSGSVSYLFSAKGMIGIAKSEAKEDVIMEVVLESGAEDVTDEDEYWQVLTASTDYHAVRTAIEEAGIAIEMSEQTMVPANIIQYEGKVANQVLRLIDNLEDQDDVQKVHANFDISDDDLAAFAEG